MEMELKINWVVVEEHFDAHPFPFYIHMDLISTKYPEILDDGFRNTMLLLEGNLMLQVFDDSEFARVGLHVLDKITSEKGFAKKIRTNARVGLDALIAYTDKLLATDLENLSNEQLAELISEFYSVFGKSSVWGTMISFVEYENFFGSKKIKEIIEKRSGSLAIDTNEIFEALSAWPEKTNLYKEKEELLQIAEKINKSAPEHFSPEIKQELKKHASKFKWISFSYQGPELDEGYFEMALREVISTGITIAQLNAKEERMNAKRHEYFQLLGFSPEEKEIIETLAELFFLKAYRRDIEFKINYALSFVFRELAKRLQISLNQARFMRIEEMIAGLRTGSVDKEDLKQREKGYAYTFHRGNLRIYSGDKALALKKLLPKKENAAVDEIVGEIASPGLAKGHVKIIRGKGEYSKFNKGDILVTISTNPNMVPLMKKAAAIVTETGGITSHAAIVSRELGVPCVIATRIATSVLKDGDFVEVDANKGIIRKL